MALLDPQFDPTVTGPSMDPGAFADPYAGLVGPWPPPHWTDAPVDPMAPDIGPAAQIPGLDPTALAGLAGAAPGSQPLPPLQMGPDQGVTPGAPPAFAAAAGGDMVPPPIGEPQGPSLGALPLSIAAGPPGPVAPDAVSEAGGQPGAGIVGGAAYAPTRTPGQLPEAAYRQHVRDALAGNGSILDAEGNVKLTDDAEAQRYFDELQARDPAKAAILRAQLDDIKIKKAITAHRAIADRDYQAQQANIAMRQAAIKDAQAKSDAINADAIRIANTKIDPAGGLSNRQYLAGAIASIVSGLVQARHGGPNVGIDALNDAISRGIDAQKANLQNQREGLNIRRGAVAEEYARHGDEFAAVEATRLAALHYANDLLATEQQNYAPRGTTFAKYSALRANVNASIASAQANIDQKNFDNALRFQNAKREQQLADETVRSGRDTSARGWAQIDIEKGKEKAKEGPSLDPKVWQAVHPDNPVPPYAMNQKEYDAFLGSRKKGQDLRNESLETTNAIPAVTVKGADGKDAEFVAKGDKPEIAKLRAKVSASTTIVNLLDQARRIRTGYSNNNAANRAEWLQMQEIWGAAKAKGKDSLGLGALSGDDYKLLDAYLGSPDPTSFRDPTDGIKRARSTVLLDVNNDLHGAGFPKGQHFDVTDTSAPIKPPEDKSVSMVLGSGRDAKQPVFGDSGEVLPVAPTLTGPERYQQSLNDLGLTGAPSPVQVRQVKKWGTDLKSKDDRVRGTALNALADVAGTESAPGATSVELRKMASELLQNAVSDVPIPSGGR